MNHPSGFAIVYLDSANNGAILNDDSATPRIVKNIERISDRYREYLRSEITEEKDIQTEQAKKVKKLQKNRDRHSAPQQTKEAL